MSGAVRLANAIKKEGMKTKIWAAKICLNAGCSTVITNGQHSNPLKKINYTNSTWFIASESPNLARKQWLLNHLHPSGTLIIDEGAEKAIYANKSLLPAGILEIRGKFFRGDVITVNNIKNKKILLFTSEVYLYISSTPQSNNCSRDLIKGGSR